MGHEILEVRHVCEPCQVHVISYTVATELACVYGYVTRGLNGRSASKTLEVGQAFNWSAW